MSPMMKSGPFIQHGCDILVTLGPSAGAPPPSLVDALTRGLVSAPPLRRLPEDHAPGPSVLSFKCASVHSGSCDLFFHRFFPEKLTFNAVALINFSNSGSSSPWSEKHVHMCTYVCVYKVAFFRFQFLIHPNYGAQVRSLGQGCAPKGPWKGTVVYG